MKLIIKNLNKLNTEELVELQNYLGKLSLKWHIIISKDCAMCSKKIYKVFKIDTKEQGIILVCKNCNVIATNKIYGSNINKNGK